MRPDNKFLFVGVGDYTPFDNVITYVDRQVSITRGMIGVVRTGSAVPTTTDIATGKYAVWYNTTSQAVGIYYNNAGTITSVTSGGGSISLTTTGTSGAATLIGGVLNIPQYSGGGGAVASVFGRTGTVVSASNDYTFAQIGSKPTTLSGYGITDPVVLTSGSYANPAWITAIPWSIIGSTPTTVTGYGITDAVTLTGVQTLTNKTITGTQITGNISGNAASITGSITESQVTNLTTDLAGKQATITLTTNGTSGVATLTGATLNIPEYSAAATVQYMWVVGGANNFTSLPGTPTAPVAGATTLVDASLTGVKVRVVRGSFPLMGINPGDGSNYYTKVQSSNTLTFSSALVNGEQIIVETIPQ